MDVFIACLGEISVAYQLALIQCEMHEVFSSVSGVLNEKIPSKVSSEAASLLEHTVPCTWERRRGNGYLFITCFLQNHI